MATQEARHTDATLVSVAALQEAHRCIYVQCALEIAFRADPAGIANNNFDESTIYHMIAQLTLILRRMFNGAGSPAALFRIEVGVNEPVLFVFFYACRNTPGTLQSGAGAFELYGFRCEPHRPINYVHGG